MRRSPTLSLPRARPGALRSASPGARAARDGVRDQRPIVRALRANQAAGHRPSGLARRPSPARGLVGAARPRASAMIGAFKDNETGHVMPPQ